MKRHLIKSFPSYIRLKKRAKETNRGEVRLLPEYCCKNCGTVFIDEGSKICLRCRVKKGALALLKIKETIINGEWDKWWETERERNIKVDKYKPPLPASCFKKEAETSPLIEVTIPAFIGPDQDKPWVGVLRKLSEVGYY